MSAKSEIKNTAPAENGVKKQDFMKGAFILMIGNIIIKVIGAFFKIPLTNLVGDTTMAYFNSAYSFYVLFFMVSTSGLPVAVSRMIAKNRAKGNIKEINKIFSVSFRIFFIIGLVGTLLMAGLSTVFANMAGLPEGYKAIIALSPTVFFICIISAFRGYFQGQQNMVPTTISQIIEALGKLFIGLAAGYIAIKCGCSDSEVAAFVILGVTVGVVFSCLSLILAKNAAKRNDTRLTEDMVTSSKASIGKELIKIAIPITIAQSMASLVGVIDTTLVIQRLMDAGFAESAAIDMYGAYTAKSVTMYNLPPTLIYPFSISLIPMVSATIAEGNKEKLTSVINSTLRIVSVIAIPFSLGLCCLSRPIIRFLYSEGGIIYINSAGEGITSTDVAAPMLSVLGIGVFFVGMISVTGAMLQAHGYERLSIVSTLIGIAVKFVSEFILLGIPAVGLYGAPISTVLCYLIMLVMNFMFLAKYAKQRPSITGVFLKPFIASAVCTVSAVLFYNALYTFIQSRLTVLLAIFFAIIVYIAVMFLIKAVNKEDLLIMPKGEKLVRLLVKFKLLA